jgi:nucleotide-binding universal stress UspA family protein
MTSRFTHILVPVDFSKASRGAMHYGAALGLKCQAKLTAAHIVPSSSSQYRAQPQKRRRDAGVIQNPFSASLP